MMMKTIQIGRRFYTWAQLSRPEVRRRPDVQTACAAVQRNPTAFGFTAADVPWIVQYSTGAFDGFSESQLYEATVGQQAEVPPQAEATKGENMATKLTPGNCAPAIDGKTAMAELSQLYGSPEYKRASQLAKTNSAKLLNDPDHRLELRAWNRAAELEGAIKAAEPKREDRDHFGNPKAPDVAPPMGVYLGKEVLAFTKNTSQTERRHLAAEHIARVKADDAHPYWNDKSPEHKAAVLGMKIATEMMQSGDSYVQLNEDGSVNE